MFKNHHERNGLHSCYRQGKKCTNKKEILFCLLEWYNITTYSLLFLCLFLSWLWGTSRLKDFYRRTMCVSSCIHIVCQEKNQKTKQNKKHMDRPNLHVQDSITEEKAISRVKEITIEKRRGDFLCVCPSCCIDPACHHP